MRIVATIRNHDGSSTSDPRRPVRRWIEGGMGKHPRVSFRRFALYRPHYDGCTDRSKDQPARSVKRGEPAVMPGPMGRLRTRALASRIPSIGRDSAVLAPSYVVPGLASLLSIPILFATLGPAQYGILALILAVANGVPQLTTGWLEAVVVRFAHRPEFHMPVRGVVTVLLGSCLVGGVLSAVLIPTADVVVAVSTALLTGTIGAYLVAIARLQGMLRFGAVSGGAVVRAIVGTIGSIAFAV